jgi:hypothetical protein
MQCIAQTYMAEPDADGDEARSLRPLQAAAVTINPERDSVVAALSTPDDKQLLSV